MLREIRKYLLFLLALLLIGFFVYKFRNSIALEGFRWARVPQSLREARISLLLLSVLGIYICYAIRALRWVRFSRSLGQPHFWNVYSATLMGFACIFLLGRAGELIRPVLIAKKDSLSVPRMFGVYVLERAFDIAATAILAGAALLVFERRGLAGGAGNDAVFAVARRAGVGLLAVLGIGVVFLIYFRYHGDEWLGRRLQQSTWRSGWRGRIIGLLEGFSEGLRGIRSWNDLGVLLGYTAMHWLLVVWIYFWVAHAFGGDLSNLDFAGAVLVAAFTLVGSAAQLPGVGGGAQLATFLVFTLIFGVEKEPAAIASVILWLVTFASCCLVGLPMLFYQGWSMGELRRMARAEAQAADEAAAWSKNPQSPGESLR